MKGRRWVGGIISVAIGLFMRGVCAESAQVEGITNTTHTPTSPRAGQDVFAETQTWPIDVGTNGFIEYGINTNSVESKTNMMEKTGTINSNDLWRGKIGRFPAGNVIKYLVGVQDEVEPIYDDNGGSYFGFTVTNGDATTWIGGIYHWPTNGAITSESNLLLNLFASPSQTLVNVFADYSVNGMLWERTPLDFWQMDGSNEWWHVEVGMLPPASLIWYAFDAEDGTGTTHIRPTNGLPYLATVEGSSTDSDEDGLPDDWEEFSFGGLTNAVSNGNPDGDGFPDMPMDNWMEYVMGTDPTDSNATEDIRVLWKPSKPLSGGAAKFSVQVGEEEALYSESVTMYLDLGSGGMTNVGLTTNGSGRFSGTTLLATNATQLTITQLSSANGTNDNRGIGWTIPIENSGGVADTDKDGMPDAWELQYGLNPFDGADANVDLDGDGWSNLTECVWMRNPRNMYSRPFCVAHYLMDETFWNGTTNEVVDASGLGNHGRTTNGATTVVTSYGTNGMFNGTNSVTVPNSTNLQVTNDLTLSFWVNMTNTPTGGYFLSKNGNSGEFGLYVETGRHIAFYEGSSQGSEGWYVIVGGDIALGKWYHVAVTRSSTDRVIRAYLNGVQKYSGTYTTNTTKWPTASTAPVIVGRGLKGLMDEVVIENRAWSSNEVATIYDPDHDFLPSLWEEANGLNPTNDVDATADPDGDGFSTVQEYFEGTNPFDPSNHPGGVRAHYLMNETNWTGATNIVDDSGLGNNGRTTNGATTVVTSYGTNGMFNGTNSVTVSNSTSLQVTGDLTLSFWVNMTNTPTGGYFLSKNGNSGEFGLYVETGRQIGFYQGSPQGNEGWYVIAGGDIALGKWCHVAVTRSFTDKTIRAYLNGVQKYSGTYTTNNVLKWPTASSAPVIVGQGLKGLMDEVVIENRAWGSNEVAAIYDPDHDFLPSLWEEANGLNPTDPADAMCDADTDTFSTVQEYFEGTNPFDPSNHPGGVRAHYLMNETNWTGATNIVDDSGLGNNGRTTNGATTVVTSYGTNGWFNGTNSVTVSNSTSLQVAGDLTVSCWINMTNTPVGGSLLAKNGNSGEFGLYVETSRQIGFYQGSPQGNEGWYVIPGGSIVTGNWYHVAVTRSFTNRAIRAYLNGVPVYSNTYTTNILKWPMASSAPVIVGQGLKGLMDEVVVENRAWSPREIGLAYDGDGDQMPRLWEEANGLNPWVNDAYGDKDEDGLANLAEYQAGTSATNHDSDGDGMPDGWEVANGLNPLGNDATADKDGDGLNNSTELSNSTLANNPDTDHDGMPDGWEVTNSLNPLVDDAARDEDNDHICNLDEYLAGTDPWAPNNREDIDTDGDGMSDFFEFQNGLNPVSGMSIDLVARWTFDDTNAVVFSNAVPTNYPVSTNYTGVLNNANGSPTTWIPGYTGASNDKALWFDGVDDFVVVTQNPPIFAQAPFSISALILQDSAVSSPYETVISDSGYTYPRITGYLLRTDTNLNSACYYVGCPTNYDGCYQPSWKEYYTSRWVHLVSTYDGTNLQLYVDGILAQTKQAMFSPVLTNLWIGRGHVNLTNSNWRGAIDDVRLYRKVLSGREIAGMYDALGDLNGNGTNNVEDTDPTNGIPESYTKDGAIDIQFMPSPNWTTNSPMRYLAHYTNANPGTEMQLYVDKDDRLNFVIFDAAGQRHSIRYGPIDSAAGLMANHHIINGITNQVVASWKNLNTGLTNAEMRLYVNGVDWQSACGYNGTPKQTVYHWATTQDGYYEALQTRIDFPAIIGPDTDVTNSPLIRAYPAQATDITTKVHTTAYGMIDADFPTNIILPFETTDEPKVVTNFPRPQAIAQCINALNPRHTNDIPAEDFTNQLAQYAQVFDGAEMEALLGPAMSPDQWPTVLQNYQKLIAAANATNFDLAIGIWKGQPAHYDRVMRTHPELTNSAYILNIDSNGMVSIVPIAKVTCKIGGTNLVSEYPSMFDVADRTAVSKYIAAWTNEIAMYYTNCSYLFLNEEQLMGYTTTYTESPTYSSNGLNWFREYCANYYDDASKTNMRFPVSPVDFKVYANTMANAATNLRIYGDYTNLLEVTTDPDHWARWWEWRRLVFANLLSSYANAAEQLNPTNINPRWKGTIFFISPSTAWSEMCAVDMNLLARIPNLKWMVMENGRGNTYGTDPQHNEEEVLLQLQGLKTQVTNGTGLGSYVMAHTYPHPLVISNVYPTQTVVISNATYNTSWMSNDLAYAVSPAFTSQLIVPYSAPLIVDRQKNPLEENFQVAAYVPEIARIWNETRYRDLWMPITNLALTPIGAPETSFAFSWSAPESAVGYELVFSLDADFRATNGVVHPTSNGFEYVVCSNSLPAGSNLFWRVRGIYHELHIANNGAVTSTSTYYGAWAPTNAWSFRLRDEDADGLPDAWEEANGLTNGMNHAGRDDDGDGLSNWAEYSFSANPRTNYTDPDGLSDFVEVFEYGTSPTNADTDGDGLSDSVEVGIGTDPLAVDTDGDGLTDGAEVNVNMTNPLVSDTDGDGMPDGWEVQYGLDPLTNAPAGTNSDSDGWSDLDEYIFGGHPRASNGLEGSLSAYRMDEAGWGGTNKVWDTSGGGYHGETTNGATTITDSHGTHGKFNGTNIVVVPNSMNLPVADELTLSFWINMTNTPVGGYILSKYGIDGEFGVYVYPTRNINFVYKGPNVGEGFGVIAGSDILPGKWYHVAVTRSFTNHAVRAYLNGTLVYSGTCSMTNSVWRPVTSEPVIIGQGLKGFMDDVVIKNQVLSPNAIQLIYDADGDRLPGLWEEAHVANEMNPMDPADAMRDKDTDGFSTVQEYYEGTNPFDSNNHPGRVRAQYLMNETNWTGTTNDVVDNSGCTNHGYATLGATTATDTNGATYGKFNGTNSVVVSNSTSLQVTGDLTLSFWVNMTNTPTGGYFLSKNGMYGEFGLYVSSSRSITFYQGSPQGSQGYGVIGGGSITTGNWYHVAVTRSFTNREIRAYLNGTQSYSTVYTTNVAWYPTASTSPVIIGQGLKGFMDNVFITNGVWSSNDVSWMSTNRPP